MGVFFIFYKLFLERENMHVFKRFYLLLAIAASFVIPSLVFIEYVVVEPVPYIELQSPNVSDYDSIGVPAALEKDVLDIEPILWTLYLLGFVFFGLKFIKNLFQIIGRIRKNPKQKTPRFVQVLLQENFPPHTFFSYIFLNKKKLEAKEIPNEVLLHEETHARQKHSFDVVGIEMLQVLFWFNPLVYLFKKAIKLNHEFLADQAVLKKNIDKTTYQNTLLSYLSNESDKEYQSQLANAINYSSIKKRFTVMKTHTSKKAMLIRSSSLLPLLLLLVVGFSETKLIETQVVVSNETIEAFEQKKATPEQLAQYNALAKTYNEQPKESRVVPAKDLKILEDIYGKMSLKQKEGALPFPECSPSQDGASREQMAEYNKLAKYYNDMPKSKMKILKKDVERLEYIYGLMSDKQKADAEPFPDFPEPPPAPKVKKGEKSDIPPPPPPNSPKPPKTLNEREEAAAMIEKIIEEQDPYDIVTTNSPVMLNSYPLSGYYSDLKKMEKSVRAQVEKEEILMVAKEEQIQVEETKLIEQEEKMVVQEAKLKAKEIAMEQEERKLEKQEMLMQEAQEKLKEKEENMQEIEAKLKIPNPPLPPEPVSPLDHIIEMAKKDAIFYYEGKEISSDEAIELLKKKKSLNIDSRRSNGKRPTVKISKEPFKTGSIYNIPKKENQKSKLTHDVQKVELVRLLSNKAIERNNIGERLLDFTEKYRKCSKFFFNGQPVTKDEAINHYVNGVEVAKSTEKNLEQGLLIKC